MLVYVYNQHCILFCICVFVLYIWVYFLSFLTFAGVLQMIASIMTTAKNDHVYSTNKRYYRKPKGQFRKDIPEKLATLDTGHRTNKR